MLGMLAWTFFASSVVMSTGAIADNGGLLKSVLFPRAILPIATVLFNLVAVPADGAGVPARACSSTTACRRSAPMLLFPVFVALQVLLTIGVALMLATGTAFFRDVRHLVEVALAVLFWTTPIVYDGRADPGGAAPDPALEPDDAVHRSPTTTCSSTGQWPDALVWALDRRLRRRARSSLGLWLIVRSRRRFAERDVAALERWRPH